MLAWDTSYIFLFLSLLQLLTFLVFGLFFYCFWLLFLVDSLFQLGSCRHCVPDFGYVTTFIITIY